MKLPRFSTPLILACIASLLIGLTGCAGLDRVVSNNDLFKDPDTKRLEQQEQMTKVTRELSTRY